VVKSILVFLHKNSNMLSVLILAIALAMDSVAVSVSCGLLLMHYSHKNALRIGLYMGLFQGVMPVIGFMLGLGFERFMKPYDHWIAMLILTFLGGKMIFGHLRHGNEFKCFDPTKHKVLAGLALATSIDALAIGITIGLLDMPIVWSCLIIGIVSLTLSGLAVYFGSKFRQKIQHIPFVLIGGIILVLIGGKIVIEHLCIEN
jgi:manganese efflux pump family protein